MQRKLISIVAGAVVSIAPFAAGIASAQTPAQHPVLPGIELTQQQQTQLTQIRQQTRSQVESILSEAQRNQFRTALQQGQGWRGAIAAANLTTDQQAQLQTVFQAVRTQMSNTLTPEQRQQFRENLRSRWGQNRPDALMQP